MLNNETHHNHKHSGVHYLTIVQQPGEEEELSEKEINRQVEEMSKELGGAPVVFVGYEIDTGDNNDDE